MIQLEIQEGWHLISNENADPSSNDDSAMVQRRGSGGEGKESVYEIDNQNDGSLPQRSSLTQLCRFCLHKNEIMKCSGQSQI